MQLKYRGTAYDVHPSPLRWSAGPEGGSYRGLVWHRQQVDHFPAQAEHDLTYRNLPYHTDSQGRATAAPEVIDLPAVAPSSQAHLSEVARNHRDAVLASLERRIASARAANNGDLLAMLEAERHLFA